MNVVKQPLTSERAPKMGQEVSVHLRKLFGTMAIGLGFFACSGVAFAQEGDEAAPEEGATEEAKPAEEAAASAAPDSAQADWEAKWPLNYVQRPLTMPAMTLRGDLGFSISRYSEDFGSITLISPALGAGFGITDDLQVDATLIPIGIATASVDIGGTSVSQTDVSYLDPDLTLTYRFLGAPNEAFQMGARFYGNIPVNGEVLILAPSIPVVALPYEIIAVAFEVAVPITIPLSSPIPGGEKPPTSVGLDIPVEVDVQLGDPAFVGLTTGFGIADFSAAGESIYVPLGFLAGYAIKGDKGPFVDIGASFSWDYFLTPGAPDGANKVNANFFTIGLGASLFLYL